MPLRSLSFNCLILLVCMSCHKSKNPSRSKDSHAQKPSTAKDKGYPISVIDERGQQITIAKRPKRIVVGGTPLYTQIVLDLGAGHRLVGITDSPDNPPEAKGLPSVGRSWPLNIEGVVALRPDVVLCAFSRFRTKLEKDAKLPVYTGGTKGGYIKTLKDLYKVVKDIDLILHGNTSRSVKYLQALRQRLKQSAASVASRPRVKAAIVYIPRAQSSQLYIVNDKGSPGSELIVMAHGQNVFADLKATRVSIEALITRDPDVIFTAPSHIDRLMKHRALTSIKAVRHKRIVGIRAASYTSTRIDRVLGTMIRGLHPTHPPASR